MKSRQIFDDVIACDLWFRSPQSKILATPLNWSCLENFFEDLFFGEHLRLCPWSLALASSIPVLGLESVCPRKGCPWPWPWPRIFFVSLALALASSLVSSTPPLLKPLKAFYNSTCTVRIFQISELAQSLVDNFSG